MFFQRHFISSNIHFRKVNTVTTSLCESSCLLWSVWAFFWPCIQNKEFCSQSLKSSGASESMRVMLLRKITSFFLTHWLFIPFWVTSVNIVVHMYSCTGAFRSWVAVHMWTHGCCHVRRWWNDFCPNYSPAIYSFLECIHINVLSSFVYLVMYKQLHPAIKIIFLLNIEWI